MEEYPDVQTFAIRSAFKYDHPAADLIAAIGRLKSREMTRGCDIDEGKCLEITRLKTLSGSDLACMNERHVNFAFDTQTAMSYFNEEVLSILPEEVEVSLGPDWSPSRVNRERRAVTSRIIKDITEESGANLQSLLAEAAHIRQCFG